MCSLVDTPFTIFLLEGNPQAPADDISLTENSVIVTERITEGKCLTKIKKTSISFIKWITFY